MRGARSEATEVGGFYELQNRMSNSVKAPELGSNTAFDQKVLLLQKQLQSGAPANIVQSVADGSSVKNGDNPFENEVREEMEKLERELREEVKRQSPIKQREQREERAVEEQQFIPEPMSRNDYGEQVKYQPRSPLRPNPPSPRPTRKGQLEKEYEIASQLEKQLLRKKEENERRIANFQEERKIEEEEGRREKIEKQRAYAEQLRKQQKQPQQQQQQGNGRGDNNVKENNPNVNVQFDVGGSEKEERMMQRKAQMEYAEQLRGQMVEQPTYNYNSNATPAYLQSPTKPSQQFNFSPRIPEKYVSPARVPPHKTPPVSPRLFPSEVASQGAQHFGTGLSTLYGGNVGGKAEQRLQSKVEYARYLERQMREKEDRKVKGRVNRIQEEKSLLSPSPLNAVPHKVHVSPAYEDHLSQQQVGSTYGQQAYAAPISHAPTAYQQQQVGSTALISHSPVVYQHQPSSMGEELNKKTEYGNMLKQQMKENEERKMREKEELKVYNQQFDSPAKPNGDVMQMMGSPDEWVDGPFGRRRLGGGGDAPPPGGVTDLKYRSNMIKHATSEEAQQHQYNTNQYNNPASNLLSPGTNNGATRQKMVADVYGQTATGAALGFGRNVSPPQRQPQQPSSFQNQFQLQQQQHPEPVYQPEVAWGTGPSITSQPKTSDHHSKANFQREALQLQMEEKRLRKEAEKRRQEEEDRDEWRRIELENERVKEEEKREKEVKKLEEQRQLEYLQQQQEKAAIKRRNGVNREGNVEEPPPDTVRSSHPASPRVRKAPAPPPKVQPLQQQQQYSPMRQTEQAGVLMSVEKRRLDAEAREESSLPALKPGDFFTVDVPENQHQLRESSPFTKNMEKLRSSVEEDFTKPLQDFQTNLHTNVARKAFAEKHTHQEQRRNPHHPPGSPRLDDSDQLEQSLRADSQFHMIPKSGGQLPFGDTMLGGRSPRGEELKGDSTRLEGEILDDQHEGDPMDSFVAQWQVANGFSAATGGYAPHRKLLHSAKAEAQLPNFAALRQMTSNRNFATGNPEGMAGMARVAAPPVVHAQDALRSTLMTSPESKNLSSNSDFITDEVANVSEVFSTARRNRNNLAEQSLKSDSLLMYIKDAKKIDSALTELQAVGEDFVEEPEELNFSSSGFQVKEIRDVVRGDSDDEDEVLVIPVSPSKGMSGPPVDAAELSNPFAVSSVTDEEREAMLEQQRSKWDIADEETYGNDDFEADLQEKEEDVILPRSNSEIGVLEKLKELEEKLGIVDGEGEGEKVVEDDFEDESEEEVEEIEEVEEKNRETRLSFTERWLGTDAKAGDVDENELKERKSFNAELIFVSGKDDEDADEVSDGSSDGSVSPPSSPTKKAASQYVGTVVASTQYVSTVIANSLTPRSAQKSGGSDKVASEVSSEGSMSPPGSPNKENKKQSEEEEDVSNALERIKGKMV
ncbi:hypothetical protein TrLO_g9415 [Triparma laevis f. longispina]|uniref:Uncharacterized protein n=1 Tax=Triparma laevis f. longispina TaxID=1714387 RepID=A0A9W6ZGW1_9STRA|nr:hypothetical protein TrLO_g9415 [Triparma laevis f. longispina]